MDSRSVLEEMNREILESWRRGTVPWRKPVEEGRAARRVRNAYANDEMIGLGGWYLEAVSDRCGWDHPLWWSDFDRRADYLALEPGAMPTRVVEVDFTGKDIHVHTHNMYCGSQMVKGEVLQPDDRQADGSESLEKVSAEVNGWLPRLSLWNVSGAVDYLQRQGIERDNLSESTDAGRVLRDEMVMGILARDLGVGMKPAAEESNLSLQVIEEALEKDPFWLQRVAVEADLMASRLLLPVNNLRNAGFEMERREALEVHFDKLRLEEPLQYLTVPRDEEQDVKALGGRYDQVAASWYVPPSADIDDFARWDRLSVPSPEAEFANVMSHHGLLVEGSAVMDGEWHRVSLEGQEHFEFPLGVYRGSYDGRPHGEFRNYRDGDGSTKTWVANGFRASESLWPDDAVKLNIDRTRLSERLRNRQEFAAEQALERWNRAEAAFDANGSEFLRVTGFGAHGVRLEREDDKILIPRRDANGKLWSLQETGFDPKGRFHSSQVTENGRKDACFHIVGDQDFGSEPVLLTTSYFSGAAIYETTGRSVAVAFEGSNLKPVAEALGDKYPDNDFFIAADSYLNHDFADVGSAEAIEAAHSVGGAVIMPNFPEHLMNTDRLTFAGLFHEVDPEAVIYQIDSVIKAHNGPENRRLSQKPGWKPPVEYSDGVLPMARIQSNQRKKVRQAGRSR